MSRLSPAVTAAACVALLGALALPASAQVATGEPRTRVSPDGKLEVRFVVGPHATIGRLASFGDPGCAVQWLTIQPGGGVPEHVHDASDETILIREGGGTFTLDGVATQVRAGATVFVPMGHKHAFSADARAKTVALQVYDPAGPETRFMAWPERAVRPAAPPAKPGK